MEKIDLAELAFRVDEVSKLFKWGKGNIVTSIKETISLIEQREEECFDTKKQFQTLIDNHNILNASHAKLSTQFDEINQNHEKLTSTYHVAIQEQEKLTNQHQALNEEHDKLTSHHHTVKTKYDLVSQILSSKSTEHEAMNEFNHLVENDFMVFANQESSLAEEAKAVLMLQNIQRELQMISSFPSIYNKNIVAVGGGFSAGKSEFISSFFSNKSIRLPIGIKPVTAIPAYITNGTNHLIKGYSYKGGSVDISTEFYEKLSHDFIKSFSFNLKDIVPLLAIETEIEKYSHVCFVDTPGYNPATSDAYTNSDHETANEYLENANVLLWVVGLDASDGAFPSSDITFLEELSLQDKKLFIIANKADLKSPDDLEDILNNFQETLDDYNIEYCGISAYSSVKKIELKFRKKSLLDFLEEVNNPINAKNKIISELENVFRMYNDAISNQINWTQNIQSNFRSLELDLMQSGFDMDDDAVNNRLEHMRTFFETNNLKSQLNMLEVLKIKFFDTVEQIFNSLNQEGIYDAYPTTTL